MDDELLTRLDQLGVRLWLDGGPDGERLRVQAPAGALTPDLRAALERNRDRLVAQLRNADAHLPTAQPHPELRHEPFQLSDVQHGYWIGRNPYLELGGVATHFYFELDGQGLALDRLEASLRRVIERHDMLRAVIQPDGRQRVLPEVPPYRIEAADLRGRPAGEQRDAIAAVRRRMQAQVIPAARWPLFEIRASQLDGDRLVLHFSLDLLIIDGWSILLFFADWRRFYTDPSWSPPSLELTFRDYLTAQQSTVDKAAERYWLDRIDELPAGPELPLAVQPSSLGVPRFSRRRLVVPRRRWQTLAALAKDRGLTPSTLLMAAFAEVLRTWAKQPRFSLNLTMFNRLPVHPQVDEIIGDFTSVILVAVDGAAGETFLQRAQRLHRQLLADLAHSSYCGIKVLRERTRRLGTGPAAAMPVVFTSALGLDGRPEMAGARDFFGEFVHGTSQTPQVWLDHQVFEESGDLVVNWDAVDALFPDGLLDEMFEAFHDLLDRLIDGDSDGNGGGNGGGGDVWSRTGGLVPIPAWQRRERDDANATTADIRARTLHGLVTRQIRSRPHATAVIAGETSLSYLELGQRASRLADHLRALGAGRGRLVAVAMEKGWEQVVAVLGVLYSGAAYLPVDPDWPRRRREFLLERTGATVVVTQDHLRGPACWPEHVEVVTLGGPPEATAAAEPTSAAEAGSPDDLAYVIFTSGSTGQPKGVAIDHGAACNTIQDLNQRFSVGRDDRVLALSALSFDLSVYDVFGPLAAGGTVVLPDPRLVSDPAHWSALIERHGITLWNSVPALMQLWEESLTNQGPPSLRLALLSGDWIPVRLPDRIRARCPGLRMISLGGATEASIWSVWYPIGEVDPGWQSIPYGKPLANQTLHVYDEWLQPCPVWTVGEIHIGGLGLARGYWADPERTAERFVTHPRTGERLYRTGDLGRYRPGGDIEFLGREDHQVKINGFRIELGEVAATIRQQPGVREALATVTTTASGHRQLVAYIVPDPADPADPAGSRLDPDALRLNLEKWLPDYMIPHHIVRLDRLPLTANGKVDLGALPQPSQSAPAGNVAPRDDLERRLLDIWRDVLEDRGFGVEDNFFELGGDSLHAVHIIGRMRTEFGLHVDEQQGFLQELLLNPTVATLASTVRDLRGRPS